jgi:hypothetical protein
MCLRPRRLGLGGLAGRNTARLAFTADVPASILAALTGTSIGNATRRANFVKRNWTDYIAIRRNDNPGVPSTGSQTRGCERVRERVTRARG